jgi:hypothetical protein
VSFSIEIDAEATRLALRDFKKMEIRHKWIAIGEAYRKHAIRMVPVRTGRLRGSIISRPRARGVRIEAGNARVPYAAPIHFGWKSHGIVKQPFLLDAWYDKTIETKAMIQHGIEERYWFAEYVRDGR